MVQTSSDKTSRSQPDRYIGGKLSVGSPVFVSHFHQLFHGRPEIIGKFGTFDHDPDLVAETAHSIGCPYNEVLCDGRIATSGGKELALELEQKGYDWILGCDSCTTRCAPLPA